MIPCAAYLNGEYGVKNLLWRAHGDRREGRRGMVEIQLNGAERIMFEKSVEAVLSLVEVCMKIAPRISANDGE